MSTDWGKFYEEKRKEKQALEEWEYEYYKKACEGMNEEQIREIMYWKMMVEVVMMPGKQSEGDPMIIGALVGSKEYQKLLKEMDKHAREVTGYTGKGKYE